MRRGDAALARARYCRPYLAGHSSCTSKRALACVQTPSRYIVCSSCLTACSVPLRFPYRCTRRAQEGGQRARHLASQGEMKQPRSGSLHLRSAIQWSQSAPTWLWLSSRSETTQTCEAQRWRKSTQRRASMRRHAAPRARNGAALAQRSAEVLRRCGALPRARCPLVFQHGSCPRSTHSSVATTSQVLPSA